MVYLVRINYLSKLTGNRITLQETELHFELLGTLYREKVKYHFKTGTRQKVKQDVDKFKLFK